MSGSDKEEAVSAGVLALVACSAPLDSCCCAKLLIVQPSLMILDKSGCPARRSCMAGGRT